MHEKECDPYPNCAILASIYSVLQNRVQQNHHKKPSFGLGKPN